VDKSLDNLYAAAYITDMESKTFSQMTADEKIAALRSMTIEERVAALSPMFDAAVAASRTVSFGKAPKDGWKASDRIVSR
jgi:hypothetical protein